MILETDEYITELIKYTRWYGGFANDEATIAWLDKYLAGWRYVRDTRITYSERLGTD